VDHLYSYGVIQPQVESYSWIFLGALDFPFLCRFSEAVSFLVVSVLPLFFVEGTGVVFFGTSTRLSALTAGFQDFMTPL
jgi:hypothetical protein